MATRADFAKGVLAGLGVVATEQNFDLLISVMSFEDSKAANNPMDTTLQTDGSTAFNDAGVRNYPTFEAGVAATVSTLSEGRYLQFRDVLRGADQTAMAMALANGGWAGTEPATVQQYILDLEAMCRTVALDRDKFYAVEVTDSAPVPDTPVAEPPVEPVEPTEPPKPTEEQTVETDAVGDAGAVNNDANEAVADAKAGKIAAMRDELSQAKAHIANLETHLAELADLA